MTEVCMFFFVCVWVWVSMSHSGKRWFANSEDQWPWKYQLHNSQTECLWHSSVCTPVSQDERAEVSVSLTWKGLVSSESPVLSSAQPVCQGNKFTPGYKWPARAGMGWHPARASFPVLFLFKHPVGWMVSAAAPPRSSSPAARAGFTSKQGKLMKQHMSNGI